MSDFTIIFFPFCSHDYLMCCMAYITHKKLNYPMDQHNGLQGQTQMLNYEANSDTHCINWYLCQTQPSCIQGRIHCVIFLTVGNAPAINTIFYLNFEERYKFMSTHTQLKQKRQILQTISQNKVNSCPTITLHHSMATSIAIMVRVVNRKL